MKVAENPLVPHGAGVKNPAMWPGAKGQVQTNTLSAKAGGNPQVHCIYHAMLRNGTSWFCFGFFFSTSSAPLGLHFSLSRSFQPIRFTWILVILVNQFSLILNIFDFPIERGAVSLDTQDKTEDFTTP